MSSTYDPVRGSDLDRARELLGITDVSTPDTAVRTDQAITAILAREGFARGVAWIAQMLYTEFAQQPTRLSDSGQTIDFSDRLAGWGALAAGLQRQLSTTAAQQGGADTAGGAPLIGRIAAGSDWTPR